MKTGRRRLIAFLSLVVFAAALTAPGSVQAQICVSAMNIDAQDTKGLSWLDIGDVDDITISIGSGNITLCSPTPCTNQLTISRFRISLDCDTSVIPVPFLGCPDDGGVKAWGGVLATTCGTGVPSFWSCNSDPNDSDPTVPNDVVCTAQTPIVIPANTPDFCTVTFRKIVAGLPSNDNTPQLAEQAVGFSQPASDATCNNGLSAARQVSISERICPADCSFLDDQCNVGVCDNATGQCTTEPRNCDDGLACTVDSCDLVSGCVNTPNDALCDDQDVCTSDACVPGDPNAGPDGCVLTPVPDCAATVPTMSEWGMILFTVLAGFTAILYLRRQQMLIS